jgi:hypothetical protein
MDDTEFEDFWFSLKANFLGFYKSELDKNKINLWSDNLNNLKNSKKYMEIQNNILYYILEVAEDIFRTENSYYGNIFESNIKRWEKIIRRINFLDKNTFSEYLMELDKLKLQIRVYLKLLKENRYNLFKELYFENNLENILEFTIETEQIIIYELLEYYYNLEDFLFKNYKVDMIQDNYKNLKTLKKIRLIKLNIKHYI